MSRKLFYRIGEACKLLDIQPYVLRYWETEFPVLSPRKSKAGQRVYSEEELQLIRRIKQLLYEEGYTIAGAKKKLESELAGEGGAPALAGAPAGASEGHPKGATTQTAASSASAAEEEDEVDDEEPSEPAVEAAPAAASTGPATPATAARALPRALDSGAGQQVERLKAGLQDALREARELLRLLSA